jgi:hypothetical protein
MVHVALLILLIMGLSLAAVIWGALITIILTKLYVEYTNTDMILAKRGIKFLKEDGVIFPGLWPVAAKLTAPELASTNADLSNRTAEELAADTQQHLELGDHD